MVEMQQERMPKHAEYELAREGERSNSCSHLSIIRTTLSYNKKSHLFNYQLSMAVSNIVGAGVQTGGRLVVLLQQMLLLLNKRWIKTNTEQRV